ncbi:hypothetical protein C5B42_00475 [Candidatus Cerribacteria bacterium 'Amazon FNV 2010 28 9']|uniref:Uncharacterized protein n=1 Tax=Candidatus Cerribacteria bacterium 'Amazon FNV 2010 28 9' TaxID=2081795 RepID=A0A317JR00_9BACT|nr:MAG: hypothetical protein C5B42_00475 [Candidatus Cerribacteria bacterium 'Amazon FNV 2010 28 9']
MQVEKTFVQAAYSEGFNPGDIMALYEALNPIVDSYARSQRLTHANLETLNHSSSVTRFSEIFAAMGIVINQPAGFIAIVDEIIKAYENHELI